MSHVEKIKDVLEALSNAAVTLGHPEQGFGPATVADLARTVLTHHAPSVAVGRVFTHCDADGRVSRIEVEYFDGFEDLSSQICAVELPPELRLRP